MIMTGNEQKELLDMIQKVKDLNDQKNEAIDTIIAYCNALEKENEMLKHQLEIAEWHIMHGSTGTNPN